MSEPPKGTPPDEPTHSHEHPHEHAHSHAHPHEHSHSHEHAHSHGHPHEHSHSHEHAHSHGHPHEHSHSHEHAHENAHENAHSHEHAHSHGHPHEHSHSHEHAHSHEHPQGTGQSSTRDPEGHRTPLGAGSGVGKVLLLDTFSGIAGDMTIAALVDLGVPFSVVERAVQAVGLSGFKLKLSATFAGAIGATHFDVVLTERQPERRYSEIRELLEQSGLAPSVKELAGRIFRILAESEAEVHRIAVDNVHFHEVGAVDAIVDIVGAAACFDYLGAKVKVTPLPLGRGFVECMHGRIPLPAPATVCCLRGFETVDAGLEAELVTPTGAAIVAGVAESVRGWPSSVPERVGWGAGTRKLPDRPNALRAVLSGASSAAYSHALLEANVDDLTGELAGHTLEALLAAGAVDAWIVPVTMKKGRPGWVLSALAPTALADAVGRCLLAESTTIGVRRRDVSRVERPRRELEVETRFGTVRIKVSEGDFGAPQLKPEFDDCKRLAAAHSVAVRDVLAEALSVAMAEHGAR